MPPWIEPSPPANTFVELVPANGIVTTAPYVQGTFVELVPSNGIVTFSPTISSTPMPLLGNLVARFGADSLALADTAAVTSWVDSISGIAAATIIGTGPTFSTNRLNGLPSVKFSGGGLGIATPGALKTAIDSGDLTTYVVFKTQGTSSYGALIAASVGGNAYHLQADGTNVGYRGDVAQTLSTGIPYAASAFSTLGVTAFNTTPTYSSTNKLLSMYVNGGAVTSIAPNSIIGTNSNTICLGTNSAANNFPIKAEVFDILVYNKPLTPAQVMQLQMWACDKYAQPYPWAALTSFNVFFGDSIMQGVQASAISKQAPWLIAQTLGLGFGQWHNVSVGGIHTGNMGVLAPTWFDPIPALIGKKTNLVGFEYYNEQLRPSYSAALIQSDAMSYLAARKAVANQRTVWGSSTSAAADPIQYRAGYDTLLDATHTNADVYVPIHTDTHIGVDGSYATYSVGDGVHLTDTTYPYLAALFVTGIQALP